MEAAIAGIHDHEFIQQTVDLIQKEKQFLYQELDKIGMEYWKTQANFIMIKPNISPTDFEAKMVD